MQTATPGPNETVASVLRERGGRRDYPARSYLFHEGDPATSIVLVESGLVRVDRGTKTGRVVLLELIASGETIGELGVIDSVPRSATASTVTATTIYHMPAAEFRTLLMTDPHLQSAVLTIVARRLRALSTQFVETSVLDAPARVAARLSRLVDIQTGLGLGPAPGANAYELKLAISQEEIGQWSGLAREGAVKGLATLRSVGVISTGRMRVHIRDLDRLHAIAGRA